MDEFRKVGMEACIEKIGRQFVNEHRDTACFSTQEMDNNVLFCFLGIDLHADSRKLCLTNDNDWDVYASCYVKNGLAEMSDCCVWGS